MNVERVKENAAVVELSEEDMGETEGDWEKFAIVGDRYHPAGMALADG